jgi:hypothetical protein
MFECPIPNSQRAKLAGMTLTPVTPETFKAWKERKLKEKEEQRQKEEKEREESIKVPYNSMNISLVFISRFSIFSVTLLFLDIE